jgi:hypothetical protein
VREAGPLEQAGIQMAAIIRTIDDTHVIFTAESVEAQKRMTEVWGGPVKRFAITEYRSIINFVLWSVRENFGLPDDLSLA